MTFGPTMSFVVPALNEENAIRGAGDEIRKAADELSMDFEVVFVNDGSSDGTGRVMDEIAAADPRYRVVHHQRNRGLGAAYRSGINAATGRYVMMVPGDNAHPADGLVPILKMAGEADIVIPYVLNPEARTAKRQAVSRLFVGLLNFLFGLDVPYYNGLVIHRTELVRTLGIKTNGFGYQAEALVRLLKAGAKHVTIGTTISEREDGTTKAFHPRNFVRVGKTILHLLWVVYMPTQNASPELRTLIAANQGH